MIRSPTEFPSNTIGKLHRAISLNPKFAIKKKDSRVFFSFFMTELKANLNFQSELRKTHLKYLKLISSLLHRGRCQELIKRELDLNLAALLLITRYNSILHQWALYRDYVDDIHY
jgi:hypothetical protein